MRLYGLIGKPLRHSFSKAWFTRKFETENIAGCRYENFELESIEDLPSLLRAHPELCGLNVTIPYKKEVLPYLHDSNEVVRSINACNCIRIREGKLSGYNTDAPGFQRSLQPLLKAHHTAALVLGTGGSSAAVQYALQQMGIAFKPVSREAKDGTLSYNDIDKKMLSGHLLVINTTPLGMFPKTDAAPDIPYDLLTPDHLLYDLVYNPEQTLFLKKGAERGAVTCNGYGMLVLQAEESWAIWNQ